MLLGLGTELSLALQKTSLTCFSCSSVMSNSTSDSGGLFIRILQLFQLLLSFSVVVNRLQVLVYVFLQAVECPTVVNLGELEEVRNKDASFSGLCNATSTAGASCVSPVWTLVRCGALSPQQTLLSYFVALQAAVVFFRFCHLCTKCLLRVVCS